jgi:hypothetical protein
MKIPCSLILMEVRNIIHETLMCTARLHATLTQLYNNVRFHGILIILKMISKR